MSDILIFHIYPDKAHQVRMIRSDKGKVVVRPYQISDTLSQKLEVVIRTRVCNTMMKGHINGSLLHVKNNLSLLSVMIKPMHMIFIYIKKKN